MDMICHITFSDFYLLDLKRILIFIFNNFRLRSCRDLDSMVRGGLFAETKILCANIMHTAGRGLRRGEPTPRRAGRKLTYCALVTHNMCWQ